MKTGLKTKRINLILILAVILTCLAVIIPSVAKYIIKKDTIIDIEVKPTAFEFCYLDGISGSDQNDGSSAYLAVLTIEKAYEVIKSKVLSSSVGYIIVSGDTFVSSIATPQNSPFSAQVIITSNPSKIALAGGVTDTTNYQISNSAALRFASKICFNAPTKFENMKLSGETDTSASTFYLGGQRIEFGENLTMPKNINGNFGMITLYGGNEKTVCDGVDITIKSGMFTEIYGAGNNASGDNTVNGDVKISMLGGAVKEIKGAGNNNGNVKGNITITVENATVENGIYGAGNTSNITVGAIGDVLSGNITINYKSGATTKFIYGGGAGTVLGNTQINVTGGTVSAAVYGGGAGDVNKNSQINITGGTVASVYGGGSAGQILGNTKVSIQGATIGGSVFGGGKSAAVLGKAEVYLINSAVTTVYGGGDASGATVFMGVKVFMTNSFATTVYGGGNASGANVSNGAQVVLLGSTTDNVYGGGNNAIIAGGARLGIDASSNIKSKAYLGGKNATVSGDIFSYIEPTLHWWLFVYIYNIGSGKIASGYNAYLYYAPKPDFGTRISNVSIWSSPDREFIFAE